MIIYPDPSAGFTDTTISIDGFLLGINNSIGTSWIFDDVTGWTLGGAVQTAFAPRPAAHGMLDARARRRERVITISGTCVAESRLAAEEAAESLAAVLADGQMGTFTVSGPTGDRSADVRLSDTPMAEWLGDGISFRWTLQFTAPDARKYGPAETPSTGLVGVSGGLTFPVGSVFDFGTPASGGVLTFSNKGTANTEPVFTVPGPLSGGVEITHVETGRRLTYPRAIGGPLVLDCKTGRASADGQDRTGNLTVREWFTVPAHTDATFAVRALGGETAATSSVVIPASVAPAYH